MITKLAQKLIQHLAFAQLFYKRETEFKNFEWDLSYTMMSLDILATALLQLHDLISGHKRLTG